MYFSFSCVWRQRGAVAFLAMGFLATFVDLGHKLVLQFAVLRHFEGPPPVLIAALLHGTLLLPFVLLRTVAGYLADRYAKPRVLRVAALASLALSLLLSLSWQQGWFWAASLLSLLLATQSALCAPARYAYLRELFGATRLTAANGALQACVTLALLVCVALCALALRPAPSAALPASGGEVLAGLAPVGWLLVAGAGLEAVLAWTLPAAPPAAPALRPARAALLDEGWTALRTRESSFLSVVGLALFWSIAVVVLTIYPEHAARNPASAGALHAPGMFGAAGVGLALGALLAAFISRDRIETGLVPIGAFIVSVALLIVATLDAPPLQAAGFVLFGIGGGLFVIPLATLVQYNAPDPLRGRVLALANLVQRATMIAFLACTVLLAVNGVAGRGLFVVLLLVAFGGALFTLYKLPQAMVRVIASLVITQRYRVEVIGFERIPQQGGVLLLGNHVSWIDWALLQIASPRPIRFVMERALYERWYMKWALDSFGVIPIGAAASRDALAEVRASLNAGEVVGLFPEGAISRSGHLGEFKRGYEAAVQGANGVIVPFYLRGLWGSAFSRSSGRLRSLRRGGIRRNIICAFGQPQPLSLPAEQLKRRVFDLSIEAWERHTRRLDTLPSAWLSTAKRMGGDMVIADTVSGGLSGHRFITGTIIVAGFIRRLCREQNVGLLLPTSNGGALANMAALLAGRTVVNLNYTASVDAVQAAIAKAGIRTVFTSQRFLDRLQQRGIDGEALVAGTQVHRLEDFMLRVSKARRLATLLQAVLLPAWLLKLLYLKRVPLESTAAILFSSGSEGSPKGVMLSHRNIMANIEQISDVLNTEDEDVLVATLPVFHAFGLTAATLMPLIEGIPTVCHPDPTDAVNVAKAVAQYRGTLLFGTSTFFRLYAKNPRVHHLMFESLRIVVAGAEKLANDVREAFRIKFGKEIYEGYGATETTPVASANLPDRLDTTFWKVQTNNKPGTVGMPLPGSSFRIVDPDTLTELPTGEDGLILIGGTQVMLGYLGEPERTAQAIAVLDGTRWYKTGDKGHLDEDGYLTIVDRYSRFAKLGGEMVSLTAVEEQVRRVLGDPELDLCAVNLPEPKKGEQIVLLVAGAARPLDELRRSLVASGTNPLMIPAEFRKVDEIPKLGSGKTDFTLARRLAEQVL